ncbi:hypothetical protein [Phytohabitans rumicis]|nr:hypothetical protein [Phytohabitans rumicis]
MITNTEPEITIPAPGAASWTRAGRSVKGKADCATSPVHLIYEDKDHAC